MCTFCVENQHDDKTSENRTRFEWGAEGGVVTKFNLRPFVHREFDMAAGSDAIYSCIEVMSDTDTHQQEALHNV